MADAVIEANQGTQMTDTTDVSESVEEVAGDLVEA
jgi:hypothetical protein